MIYGDRFVPESFAGSNRTRGTIGDDLCMAADSRALCGPPGDIAGRRATTVRGVSYDYLRYFRWGRMAEKKKLGPIVRSDRRNPQKSTALITTAT